MGAAQVGIAVPNFWFAMLLGPGLRRVAAHRAGGRLSWVGRRISARPCRPSPSRPSRWRCRRGPSSARVLRSALIDTLDADYVRTARAKGLSARAVLWRHCLRNALIPVLTILGLQFSFLLAGAIIIENVFFLPGLGRLIFQGITQRDLIVVQSVTMLLVAAVILVTFLVETAYALADPRLRRAPR